MQLRCFLFHILNFQILYRLLFSINSVSAICEFSITQKNKVYNYNLASSSQSFPHGVLSEDGYYKVSSNGTVVWFQLCDGMIFNHDPPRCFDCVECGGSSRCGMGCSALMSNILGSYPVCTTIGRTQSITTDLIDKESPGTGVVVKMWHQGPEMNCSLSVSVVCDSKQVHEPKTLERVGTCNFATQITHPAGCANVLSTRSNGLGWFSKLLIILLCFFGGYLIAGASYRFFYLGILGIDIIPNLEVWASLPHRVRVLTRYFSLLDCHTKLAMTKTGQILTCYPTTRLPISPSLVCGNSVPWSLACCRVYLCPWFGDLEGLLNDTEVHILRLTFNFLNFLVQQLLSRSWRSFIH